MLHSISYYISCTSIYAINVCLHISKSHFVVNIRFRCPYLLLRNLLKHVKIDLKKSELVELHLRCVSMTLNVVRKNTDYAKIFYL